MTSKPRIAAVAAAVAMIVAVQQFALGSGDGDDASGLVTVGQRETPEDRIPARETESAASSPNTRGKTSSGIATAGKSAALEPVSEAIVAGRVTTSSSARRVTTSAAPPVDATSTTTDGSAPTSLLPSGRPSTASPDSGPPATTPRRRRPSTVAPSTTAVPTTGKVPSAEPVPKGLPSGPPTAPADTAPPTTFPRTTTTRLPVTTTQAPTTTGAPPTTLAPTTTRPAPTTQAPTTTRPPTTTQAPTTTRPPTTTTAASGLPWHVGITASVFWIGESASSENGHIPNAASAWDGDWQQHYGGYDDPNNRNGYHPTFTPRENPFYIALPYNDFGSNGARRSNASSIIPWASSQNWTSSMSMVKNQWIEIRRSGKTVYAQWEDVGPFLENDSNYVFGSARPSSSVNSGAGIDLSPAVRDYLGVGGISTVDWRFVSAAEVPAGPWKNIVTTSQVNWN